MNERVYFIFKYCIGFYLTYYRIGAQTTISFTQDVALFITFISTSLKLLLLLHLPGSSSVVEYLPVVYRFILKTSTHHATNTMEKLALFDF